MIVSVGCWILPAEFVLLIDGARRKMASLPKIWAFRCRALVYRCFAPERVATAHLHFTWTDDTALAVTAVAAVEGDNEFEKEEWQRVRGFPLDFQLFTTKTAGPPVTDVCLSTSLEDWGGWTLVRWLGSSFEPADVGVTIGEPAVVGRTKHGPLMNRLLLYKTDPPAEVEADAEEEDDDWWWFPLLVEVTARLWEVRFV
jgi:hypothetical protein